MHGRLVESHVESVALGWFAELGYKVLHGNEIAPGPGKPAVWLIADALVAGMQKVATETLVVVPGVPSFTTGSMKQRWLFTTHGPVAPGQLLLV